ncbi:diguanylate cyclase regulator RdcB family protein [Enterobacter sp. Ap-1006]|uniref:diguanylate cyclase regulator RdcB family protein n=1 Tax=Enterobacter sp. Ap-1006 TaxID=2608345 RepID=UPI0025702652|nr:diguanylate cyclase regulator RdcB family protein [Enterobacter sp. Ap-1006]
MSSVLMEGPIRTLSCLSEKFVVDFAMGIDVARQPWSSPQSQAFYEQLLALFVVVARRQAGMAGTPPQDELDASLISLGQLSADLAKSYLANSQISERIAQLEPVSARTAHHSAAARERLQALREHFSQRLSRLEEEFQHSDLVRQGMVHSEQIFSRWRSGHYFSFSPAARCYVALEELRWGTFGDAVRLGTPEQAEALIEHVRSLAISRLAEEVNASPRTRHYFHDWLATPTSPGLLEHKDALTWLGAGCDIERQPICYSVTQSWQGVALGMPRICSAMRLGSALVDEVFG